MSQRSRSPFSDRPPIAATSTRLLPNAGDTSGACNRAYYAMFDAAHAALLISGISHEIGKTHSGLTA